MRRCSKGFTLFETLVAMMILSMGILLLTSSWSGSYARMRNTQRKTEVVALLQRKMVELDIKYRGKPVDTIDEEVEDNFGDEYPQYRWKMTSKELEFPDLSNILMAQGDGADEKLLSIMKQLTEHLGKTVKEVKVSVFYSPGGGIDDLEYSLTTYFVDFNKEVPVPGGL